MKVALLVKIQMVFQSNTSSFNDYAKEAFNDLAQERLKKFCPGISLPCGEDKDGLPIGLQLLGQTFDEKKIIQTAFTYEKYRLQNMNLKCDKSLSHGKEA